MNRGDIADIYPLTPMQEGLLFHSLLEPGSGVYVIQQQGLLEGDLDVTALSSAWNQAVERRAILRTSFEWEELERPLQIVHRQVHVPLVEQDWTTVSAREQETRWQKILEDDRRRGFDLYEAPLMRLVIARVGPRAFRFLWSHHHILMDGWSRPLLLKEVFALYEAQRRGTRLELPTPRAFRDYVVWLEQQDQQGAEAFWREKLSGFEDPVRLGIDAGVADVEASNAEERHLLTAEESRRLEEFARRQKVPLNTLVQAAWAVVLGRYSGREDLVFGEVVAGRSAPVPGIESIVGPLINTLPVRTQVDPNKPISQWLAELQRQSVELRKYEFSPLMRIQQHSDVAPGRRLFEYLFVFENCPLDPSVTSAAASGLAVAGTVGDRAGQLSAHAARAAARGAADPRRDVRDEPFLRERRAAIAAAPATGDATVRVESPAAAGSHRIALARRATATADRMERHRRGVSSLTVACMSCSKGRSSGRRRRRRCWQEIGSRATANSTRKQINWRIICGAWGSGRTFSLGSAWNGRRTWWWGSLAFSKRAGHMYRSIRSIRSSGSPT